MDLAGRHQSWETKVKRMEDEKWDLEELRLNFLVLQEDDR